MNSQKKIRQKSGFPWWSYAVGWLVLVVLLFVMVILIMRKPALRIQHISVSGGDRELNNLIQRHVDQILQEKFLWVIPKDGISWYPQSEVRTILLQNYPEIRSVSFHMKTDRMLMITLEFFQVAGVWCSRNDIDAQCWYVDPEGFAFIESPYFSSAPFLLWFDETEREVFPERNFITDAQDIRRIQNIITSLVDDRIKIKEIYLMSHGDVALVMDTWLDILLPQKPRLIIPKDMHAGQVIMSLELLQKVERFQQQSLSNIQRLQKIDLRFADRVVYEFREEN